MKNACMFLVAAALVLPTGAVLADPPGHAKAWGYKDKQGRAYKKGYREGRRDAQSIGSNTRLWRGDDGRYYCKLDDGTTGLIIGAAVGGLADTVIHASPAALSAGAAATTRSVPSAVPWSTS